MKKFFWVSLFVAGLALTPKVFMLADLERGFNGTGGEIFFPFLVPLAWAICKTWGEFLKEVKRSGK